MTYENRQFIFQLGGPTWVVQLGRRDSTTASLDTANNDIPAPTLDLGDLTKSFSNKGLSATDMIALSGTVYVNGTFWYIIPSIIKP